MISKQQLKNICNAEDEDIDKYLPHLNMLMDKYEINNPNRRRHFIAQILHESLNLSHCTEMYNGNPTEYFKKYDNRKDLGNSYAGDGLKFKGRGLIQLTGRYNYNLASIDIFGDQRLINNPEFLEQPPYAVEVACWFWVKHHLNSLADNDQLKAITIRINGGLNGYNNRLTLYNLAKKYIL